MVSLWKGRFTKAWRQIKSDEKLWDPWYAQAKERVCNEAYKLQGMKVLNKCSTVVGEQVLRSIDINSASSYPVTSNASTQSSSVAISPSSSNTSSQSCSPNRSQIVGFQMPVFIITLLADGLCLTKLAPSSSSMNFCTRSCFTRAQLVSILYCFESWCSSSLQIQSSSKRKSLDDETFASLVSPTRYGKRCYYTSH